MTMADTGCQSCLASIQVIRRLGLSERDLIPVTMQMHAVNNNGINIMGAVILRFSGRSPSGATLESRQLVYVTSDSDKLFLSRETCTALGMITKNFPTVGETIHACSTTEPDTACNVTETPPQTAQRHLRAHPAHRAPAHVAKHHHPSPPNFHFQRWKAAG